jgi:hypothetical protein
VVLADERLNCVSPRGKVAQFEDSIAVALCGICLAILIAYAQGNIRRGRVVTPELVIPLAHIES